VLFAPGVTDAASISSIVAAVDRPVNVLVRPGAPTIAELGALGVARISVGGSFAWVALDAVITAATELRDAGTCGYGAVIPGAVAAARAPFGG
jgi:2-methylisocitrate lyase-like PEP mutase family enzyme